MHNVQSRLIKEFAMEANSTRPVAWLDHLGTGMPFKGLTEDVSSASAALT